LEQLDSKSVSKKGNSGGSSWNFDEWEKVSESEINLEGMEDPFKDKWKNLEKKYFEESNL